ncbi:hypothetical protein V8F06_010407 [Rhypophila decipiens]
MPGYTRPTCLTSPTHHHEEKERNSEQRPENCPQYQVSTNRHASLPPLLAAVALGYGVTAYREGQIDRHLSSHSPTSYSSATLPTEKETQAEFEKRRKKFNQLADAYGDRSSLEELEHAMRVYEAQQGNE